MSRNNRNDQWNEIRRLYGGDMIVSTAHLALLYLADKPERAIAWIYYGAAVAELSRYSEAVYALRRAARLCLPGHTALALVYYQFGQMYERKGALRVAKTWYRRAIKSSPSDA